MAPALLLDEYCSISAGCSTCTAAAIAVAGFFGTGGGTFFGFGRSSTGGGGIGLLDRWLTSFTWGAGRGTASLGVEPVLGDLLAVRHTDEGGGTGGRRRWA